MGTIYPKPRHQDSCHPSEICVRHRRRSKEDERTKVRPVEPEPQLNPPLPTLTSPRLTDRKIRLLKYAQQGDYTVKILNGVVTNTPHLVVLLGEMHMKDRNADLLGKALLREFPVRGLEWGNPIAKVAKSLVDKLTALLDRTYPSTIQRAFETESNSGTTENIKLEKNMKKIYLDELLPFQIIYLHVFAPVELYLLISGGEDESRPMNLNSTVEN